jgi:glycosidase
MARATARLSLVGRRLRPAGAILAIACVIGRPPGLAATPEEAPTATWPDAPPMANVPAWAADAVFYQIFPERFRNGDPTNDPVRASLEFPASVPDSWTVTLWTGDWYVRAPWERESGSDFYQDGVFNRRYGGDLRGVLDRLDYLVELGINAVYFNPVFYARSLHKYDSSSLHHVDPYFGPDPAGDLKLMAAETADPQSWRWTAADRLFLKLVQEAHRRGVRIIIDGVFNHTGRDFFAFADVRKRQQDSPYADWYTISSFDRPQTPRSEFRYRGWSNVASLPEFADAPSGDDLHPGPKAYVMNITRRWMDPNGDGDPGDGVDGWRLDVADEVPLNFWKQWNREARRLNPQAYTVAEVWNDARTFLVEGGFSATMNYYAFAFPTKGFLVDGRLSASGFARELQARRRLYPPAMQFALQNLVDSHDTERLASMIVNRPGEQPYRQPDRFDYDTPPRVSPRRDGEYQVRAPNDQERRIQRMVVLLQMTYQGAPMIYYGDEAGMWGGDDPCDRGPMLWSDLAYDDQSGDPLGRARPADPVRVDDRLLAFYRSAIALRRASAVLRQGSFAPAASDDGAQFFAFRRQLGEAHCLVALNRGDKPYVWKLPAGAEPQPSLALATDEAVALRPSTGDQPAALVLPALSAAVIAIK